MLLQICRYEKIELSEFIKTGIIVLRSIIAVPTNIRESGLQNVKLHGLINDT